MPCMCPVVICRQANPSHLQHFALPILQAYLQLMLAPACQRTIGIQLQAMVPQSFQQTLSSLQDCQSRFTAFTAGWHLS